MPRSGMNGTPFSAACSPAWIAGQVESRSVMRPFLTASVKRGAKPYSPSVMAAASTLPTQPAPISMSAWKPAWGTAIRRRSRAPRRTRARTAAMAQPE